MNLSRLSLPSKLLLGIGGLTAVLLLMGSTANATTSPAGPGGSGGNATTPNAGDRLLVVTTQTGLAGRLYIRSDPGTNNPQVALANHGDYLTATGRVQTASDGTVWWEVQTATGTKGWSESNYLQDTGPGTGA